MSLAESCENSVDMDVRDAGERLQREGHVELLVRGTGGVYASVVDRNRDFTVYINWRLARDRFVDIACECDDFNREGMCEHIWATMLEADLERLTAVVPNRRGLALFDVELPDPDEIDEEIDAFSSRFPPADDRERNFGRSRKKKREKPAPPKPPDPSEVWKSQFQLIAKVNQEPGGVGQTALPALPTKDREVWYVLSASQSATVGGPLICVFQREQRSTGEFGKLKTLHADKTTIGEFPRADDRRALKLLTDCYQSGQSYGFGSYYSPYARFTEVKIPPEQYVTVFSTLSATGRLMWITSAVADVESEARRLVWDDGPPYRLRLRAIPDDAAQKWNIVGLYVRGDEVIPLDEVVQVFRNGLLLFPDRIARCDLFHHFGWITQCRTHGSLSVLYRDRDEFLKRLWSLPDLPELDFPEALRIPEVRVPPVGVLRIRGRQGTETTLRASIAWRYGDREIAPSERGARPLSAAGDTVLFRDLDAESELLRRLASVGVQARPVPRGMPVPEDPCELPFKQFNRVVETLIADGWFVEADRLRIHRPGDFKLSVTSGVDWFELDGGFDFNGETVQLPALLAALERGDRFVRLSDGSQGMLPDEWLAKYGSLAGLGESDEGKLKFRHSQALLLDALLTAQEQDRVDFDEQFAAIREKLRTFTGVSPSEPPESFAGTLRNYQKQGLGWLEFLNDFGFGGCLADDMGLGKTVQVLALLESRRRANTDAARDAGAAEGEVAAANGTNGVKRKPRRKKGAAPGTNGTANGAASPRTSLVVVPKSLVFNWVEEAKRFAPDLKVLNYTGTERAGVAEKLTDHDVVVTTYGTLRNDIVRLKEIPFDYAVLDESQAIKNAQSQAAKACRLINARRRLAMTGTPVENHLGELWSLFEFLNPGMLGRSSTFQSLSRRPGEDQKDSLKLLARGLAPFLLRRTKKQVLTELPDKTEQTLFCVLDPAQRKQYDDLRDYYRLQLTQKIEMEGMAKSKIVVLEALLRLRQAACHPGLLDDKQREAPSAKFDVLLEQLEEVAEEGHKALVFSQFTSLLSLLRRQLDDRKIVYEYLDGKTRNRQQKVERFQTDEKCPLFLISLKAGGHGLNLTAADYVFILDPWWNPAVEAQAVDRAHRIGQTRPVFAYRLIARDTVEEKILELQRTKRDLADAIVGADGGVLKNLTAEDLQLLLS